MPRSTRVLVEGGNSVTVVESPEEIAQEVARARREPSSAIGCWASLTKSPGGAPGSARLDPEAVQGMVETDT